MIELTKLNGHSFYLNVFLVEQFESLPDTTITLTTGKKLVVKESMDEVNQRIVSFMKNVPLVSSAAIHEGVSSCSKARE
ncbi:flagellar FlbD family protein [Terrilactibacillus laevilacticus]|uniref:Flagellar FlbD family protein n=1 Tax=Terrilactibacillus laevilacticus TaxID=1380157 RepID=A0ABW5PPT2_9BACI|nr:flagellar FlbD family protein [Terrilactibacillus laevilacticus]